MALIADSIAAVLESQFQNDRPPDDLDFVEASEEVMKLINEQKWVIWSNEHDAWWKANRCGYTTLYADAGIYSYEDAVLICSGANWGCSGDGDMDKDGRARAGQGRPMETMLPATGCYGKKENIKHPEVAA